MRSIAVRNSVSVCRSQERPGMRSTLESKQARIISPAEQALRTSSGHHHQETIVEAVINSTSLLSEN